MEKKVYIEGMSCEHCVAHVKEALSAIEGVMSVAVSLKEKNAVISFTGVTDEQIKNAIEDEGYDVVKIENV